MCVNSDCILFWVIKPASWNILVSSWNLPETIFSPIQKIGHLKTWRYRQDRRDSVKPLTTRLHRQTARVISLNGSLPNSPIPNSPKPLLNDIWYFSYPSFRVRIRVRVKDALRTSVSNISRIGIRRNGAEWFERVLIVTWRPMILQYVRISRIGIRRNGAEWFERVLIVTWRPMILQ